MGWRIRLPEVTRKNRYIALGVLLFAQAVFFATFFPNPPAVIADNTRYEVGGWHLATGRGLSLPRSVSDDPDVRSWACSRHPEACDSEDGSYPVAIYPPGYQFYIAGIYKVFGRSLYALLYSQLVLLLVMFAIYEALAARLLDKIGYWFCVAVGVTYPYLARQATIVLSDHVHAVLLLASLSMLVLMRPGRVRGVVFGLTLASAILVRPYSLLAVPLLFLVPAVRRGAQMTWSEWFVAGIATAIPFLLWLARNEEVFGRFIPISTQGLGTSLYLNKLEWTTGSVFDAEASTRTIAELNTLAGGDFTTWRANREIQIHAVAWMKDHPGLLFLGILKRIPRLWVSMGYHGGGISRAFPILVLQLGGLLALGCGGLWIKRRDARWAAFALTIVVTWAFLLHTPAEARRTLPLRLPMALFAGAAVSAMLTEWSKRRDRVRSVRAPATEASAVGADDLNIV